MSGDNHTIPLAMMVPGERGTLKEIRGLRHHLDGGGRAVGRHKPEKKHRRSHLFTSDRGHRLEHRLHGMGLLPGTRVSVVQNSAPGPVIVAVKDSRLCLGRGLAQKLMVNPDKDDHTCQDRAGG